MAVAAKAHLRSGRRSPRKGVATPAKTSADVRVLRSELTELEFHCERLGVAVEKLRAKHKAVVEQREERERDARVRAATEERDRLAEEFW